MKDVLIAVINVAIIFAYFKESEGNDFCTTPDGKPGECVQIRACESLTALIRRGSRSQEDVSFLRKSQCDYIQGQPWVCCAIKLQTTTTMTRRPRTSKAGSNRNRGKNINNIELPRPEDGVCGKQYDNVPNRVFGGEETLLGEFPWMALLIYERPNKRMSYGCGGSLITSKHVLTAAHCVIKKLLPVDWTLVKTRLGEWDRSTNPDCQEIDGIYTCAYRTVDVKISREYPHESYDSADPTKAHDIAVLRLESHVKFNEFIKPICLQTTANTDYGSLTVIGFGKTETGSAAERLVKAEIDIMPQKDCARQYYSQGRKIIDSQLCARGEYSDSCKGDSGGPLMKQSDTQPFHWSLVGVTSFGPIRCGSPDYPGVYTRVESYLDWIKMKIKL